MSAQDMAQQAIEQRRAGEPAAADGGSATSVREATFDLLRAQGMTTIFGNPGSTELPMLKDFPEDFRYVLGLQEAVVVGMADGYAQVTNRPALVNLHTTPGVGHAMGSIVNAQSNRSPVVVTAGQQSRAMMGRQALLTNVDATTLPKPAVKWSHEPARAQDVPSALARGIHLASIAPRGPVFLSLPMDDWDAPLDDAAAGAPALLRTVTARAALPDTVAADLARRIDGASNPALVVGGDVDACGGWHAAVALAETAGLPVWAAAVEGRIGFPEDHRLFRGALPPAMAPVGQMLAGHDLVVVVGAPVFKYYPDIPGPVVGEGVRVVQITSDPDEAARALTGEAFVADPALALEQLAARVDATAGAGRPDPGPRAEMPAVPEVGEGEALPAGAVLKLLAGRLPEDALLVQEAPSAALAFRNHIKVSRPSSYLFVAGGGLGFGLSGAVGAQLAAPSRRVVAVLGEGSAQYTIAALWTAAAYRIPVTIVILRNDEYAILKWFSALEQVAGAPGLDLPGIDTVAVARGYGVEAVRAASSADVDAAFADAFGTGRADGPLLVEVPVAPGMAV